MDVSARYTYDQFAEFDARFRRYEKEIVSGINKLGQNVVEGTSKAIEDMVSGWKPAHRPKPVGKIVSDSQGVDISIGVEETDVFRYLNEGTDPHFIAPRRPEGMLVFEWPGESGLYTGKTSVGTFVTQDEGYSAPTRVRAFKKVFHPGNAARNWTQAIGEKIGPEFVKAVQELIDKIIHKRQYYAGGEATYEKYGPEHYEEMARKSWSEAARAKRAANRAARKAGLPVIKTRRRRT